MYLQGVLFKWDPPKKCQPVSKFWHLELFWWDLLQGVFLDVLASLQVSLLSE